MESLEGPSEAIEYKSALKIEEKVEAKIRAQTRELLEMTLLIQAYISTGPSR